jgi:hypothetical protein
MYHHHHYQPINILTAEVQAFLMEYTHKEPYRLLMGMYVCVCMYSINLYFGKLTTILVKKILIKLYVSNFEQTRHVIGGKPIAI